MQDHAAREEYSRADVRRMLRIGENQLRAWERQGLVAAGPGFSFSDLIAFRTLQKLRDKGVPPRRISLALQSLKEKLKEVKHPLAELRIVSDGRAIAVYSAGEKMEAISGQLLFDFDTGELGSLRTLPERRAPSRDREAEACFQNGVALEETGAPADQVIEAYTRAVELNPRAAGALVNLGTIQYRLGRFKEAARFYSQALLADPSYPLAHFNMGNLQDEMGAVSLAAGHYEKALALNPNYADAHFNLALLSERTGDPLKAVRHWRIYLRLDHTSSWAEIARKQLERLKQTTIVRK